ncbi:MAG: hypothetical protein JW803_08890 [Endomicrobiales bacterium]|nr:hypothetical protein [Endomicrobiales bacterium]
MIPKKALKKNNQKGQAMVETLLVIMIITLIGFAAIEMSIMVVNDIISNEAAFSINRVAIVAKESQMKRKTYTAAAFLLGKQLVQNVGNFNHMPYRMEIKKAQFTGPHNRQDVFATKIILNYVARISFGSLFGGEVFSIGNVKFKNKAYNASMVKSPDEEFYDKAYPGASKF